MEISLDSIDVERRPVASGLRRSCQAKPVILAAVGVTTGSLSKPFFGLHARARRGEIYRKRFGKWFTVYTRFWRWAKKGVWERVFKALCDDPDFEYVLIDGTLVRVHQHGTGAKGGLKIRP